MGLPRRNNERPTTQTMDDLVQPEDTLNPFSFDDDDDDLVDDTAPVADGQDRTPVRDVDDDPVDDDHSDVIGEAPAPAFKHGKIDEIPKTDMPGNGTAADTVDRPDGKTGDGLSTAGMIGLTASMVSFMIAVPMLGVMLSILLGGTIPLIVSGAILVIIPFVGLAGGAMSLSHKNEKNGTAIMSIILSVVSILTIGMLFVQEGAIESKIVDITSTTISRIAGSKPLQPSIEDSGSSNDGRSTSDGKTGSSDSGPTDQADSTTGSSSQDGSTDSD